MKFLLGSSATHFSLPSIPVERKQFADGEIYIRLLEKVKNEEVTIISNILSNNILELFLLVDAVRRAEGNVVRIIIPYLSYARQDKLFLSGEAVSGAVVCSLLANLNIPITIIDMHSTNLQQYLSFNNQSVLSFLAQQLPKKKYTVIAPDKGGKERAEVVAKLLKARLVVMEKSRKGYNVAISFSEKLSGTALIVDDMISGGATLIEAAKAAKKHGADDVIAIATHGLLAGDARKKLEASAITKIIVSNTLPVVPSSQITVIDVINEIIQA